MIDPRIFADFNDVDEDGYVTLGSNGSLRDIETLGLNLEEGMHVRIADGDLRAQARIHGPGSHGFWRAEIIGGPYERRRRPPEAIHDIAKQGEARTGIASGLIWHPSTCYFEQLATDAREETHLFAAARMPTRTYLHVVRALAQAGGAHSRIRSRIEAFRPALANPESMLVFSSVLEGRPTRWRKVRELARDDLGARVSKRLLRGDPDDIHQWADVLHAASRFPS